MAEPPPPSYDAVVTGTWQQDNTVPQNTIPLLRTAPQYGGPVSLTDVLIDQNNSLHSSQQSLPQNTIGALTTEAPPPYNATISQSESNIPDNTQDEQSTVVVNTTSNNEDEDEEDTCSNCFGAAAIFCIGSPIPIAMILLGLSNMENCYSDSNIPVYSMISGILTQLVILFMCAMTIASDEGFCSSVNTAFSMLTIVAHFGVQCWGSYLVFGSWQHWRADDFDCDKSTYLLSFSTLIIYWTLGLCLCKAGSG